MAHDIWVLTRRKGNTIEDACFGLIGEARRVLDGNGAGGSVTVVAIGTEGENDHEVLGSYGADRVIHVKGLDAGRYHGELFARALCGLVERFKPSSLLMAQSVETADLCGRLGAMLKAGVVTRAMDFSMGADGKARALRPTANGYLFEEIRLDSGTLPIICFLPSVLAPIERDVGRFAEVLLESVDVSLDGLKTRVIDVVETSPEHLDIEEAEMVVAGGRGVGKGETFDIIHKLAKLLGGVVAGSRPVIDWRTLPFERQIGQTGKNVAPRLIFNCGISGANEYTAGMEKSHLSIAVNKDQRARIFRFADLGIVGDVHEVLPLLISRLEEMACGEDVKG